MPALHFKTFKLQDMCEINPFDIQKALDGVASKVRNATQLKNETLLVEVFNEKQVEVLLKTKLISCFLVHVERSTSLMGNHSLFELCF
jgi:hypothetical protein